MEVDEHENRKRFRRLGPMLIILSFALWGLLLLLPFIPISNVKRTSMAIFIIAMAEVLFWVGAVLTGKKALSRFTKKRQN